MQMDRLKQALYKESGDGIFTFGMIPDREPEKKEVVYMQSPEQSRIETNYRKNLSLLKIMVGIVIILQAVYLGNIMRTRYLQHNARPDCFIYDRPDQIPTNNVSRQYLFTPYKRGETQVTMDLKGHLQSLQYPFKLLVPIFERQRLKYELDPSGVRYFHLQSSCVKMNIVVLPDGLGFIHIQDADLGRAIGFYNSSAKTNSYFFDQVPDKYNSNYTSTIQIRPHKDLKFDADLEFHYQMDIRFYG